MNARVALYGFLAAACFLCSPAAAQAAGLTVNSSSLTFGSGHDSGTIRIQSGRSYPDVVQVRVYRWTGGSPVQNLQATDDILGVPEIFTIPPGGSQVVRVAMRGPLGGADEQAYRVIVEEIPSKYVGNSFGFGMLMRLNFPVYVMPGTVANPQPVWNAARTGNTLRLSLTNRGNVHLRIRGLQVFDSSRSALASSGDDVTVMPADTYTWTLHLSRAPAGALRLEAQSETSTIRTAL